MAGVSAAALLTGNRVAFAQKKYDDGASDTEIKIGHTNPYSGPASSYGVIGKTHRGLLEERQRGRRHQRPQDQLHHLDDGYSPPKTVEMVRQLVEQDKVLCTFNTLGTPSNTAIHKYMNQKKVPMLFVATGASKWGDPKEFPWTMGFQPDYHTEGVIYAKHILANVKDAKIAVLMQNDDYGKDYWNGFKEGLGKDADKDRQARDLRGDRSDGRQPGHPAQGLRRQRLLQHRDPEVRRPGDAQGGRHRLEAGDLSQQRVVERRLGDEAGRLRERPGRDHRACTSRIPPTSSGTANADMKTWVAWMGKYNAGGQPAGCVQRLRLRGRRR